jgi:predicted RND superfamily exporter protein
MLVKVSNFILKRRILLIVILSIFTAFMGYHALKVQLSYEYTTLLSDNNQEKIEYDRFKQLFGEDGSIYVIGVKNPKMFELEQFNEWYDLGLEISKIDGVEGLISTTTGVNLSKNQDTHQFDITPIVTKRPTTQAEVDSIKNLFLGLKFYEGLLYNPKTQTTLMAITLDKTQMNNKKRIEICDAVTAAAEKFRIKNNLEVHYSGMPYIATITMSKVKKELFLFVIGSIIIAAFIMYLFFRSFRIVLSSLLVVGISIVWVLGTLALFGFEITILSGVIPSLVVIIVLENCIYILNKYHWNILSTVIKLRHC